MAISSNESKPGILLALGCGLVVGGACTGPYCFLLGGIALGYSDCAPSECCAVVYVKFLHRDWRPTMNISPRFASALVVRELQFDVASIFCRLYLSRMR